MMWSSVCSGWWCSHVTESLSHQPFMVAAKWPTPVLKCLRIVHCLRGTGSSTNLFSLEWFVPYHSSIQVIVFWRHQTVLRGSVGEVLCEGALCLQKSTSWDLCGSFVEEVVFITDGLMGWCQDSCFSPLSWWKNTNHAR